MSKKEETIKKALKAFWKHLKKEADRKIIKFPKIKAKNDNKNNK